jgi:chloramphenicol 3-O phosphotransferase
MSKIILLNGCGSAGKTSIARSIQYLSCESWLTFGIDTFIEMILFQKEEGRSRYFDLIPGKNERGLTMRAEKRPEGEKFFSIISRFADLLASNDNNLIIDEILLGDVEVKAYLNTLQNHTVYFVGVFCDLAKMQEREILRRDRAIGLSNDQIDRVHAGLREYDLSVDTTHATAFEVARQILDFIEHNQAPQGFAKMRSWLR